MPRVALLTMADLGDFVTYDHRLVAPLAARGWQAEFVPWDAGVDWAAFAAVILRSPWDYQERLDEFLHVLAAIEACTTLFNPLQVVRDNVDKRYLQRLEAAGCAIVPTRFHTRLTAADIDTAFSAFASDCVVLKPTVSASALHTFVLERDGWCDDAERVLAPFAAAAGRHAMLQPFVDSVITEGEVSLFYFDAAFSHAVRKTPKPGDFRVQEEYGSTLAPIAPDAALLAAGRRALDTLGEPLLYARVDLVRHAGRWALMELELIEPSLYFDQDARAAERFAAAFTSRMADFPAFD
jgi:glutathione synthase/RimK-type ligase-like ATP-grasp enzyme